MKIFIFVRKGCCLCETLKNRLTKINFKEIKPNLEINEIDIDRFDLYQDKYKKFDHEVPVVAIKESTSQKIIELPIWFHKNDLCHNRLRVFNFLTRKRC